MSVNCSCCKADTTGSLIINCLHCNALICTTCAQNNAMLCPYCNSDLFFPN